jgi:hypothetical protein
MAGGTGCWARKVKIANPAVVTRPDSVSCAFVAGMSDFYFSACRKVWPPAKKRPNVANADVEVLYAVSFGRISGVPTDRANCRLVSSDLHVSLGPRQMPQLA